MGRIAILTAGLWRLRNEVAAISGLEPVRGRGPFWPAGIEAVGGWGHKATAAAARNLAARRGLQYLAFEDGFLRSVRPGPAEPPSALVCDRQGIYYDARAASDLESMIAANAGDARAVEAGQGVIEVLRRHRLSKYNAVPRESRDSAGLTPGRPRIVVVDQTFGDASIAGGMADDGDFRAMLAAAVADNPAADIVVRLHPEVISGAKRGYLLDMARRERLTILSAPLNPWRLFEGVRSVYTVSSQLGLEALMAGCRVTCFGMPFYAGWGLTDDRKTVERRGTPVPLAGLVAAAYLGYSRYFDAWSRAPVDFATAAGQLQFLARHFQDNSRPVIGWRVPRWKRRAVSRMLDGVAGPVTYTRSAERAFAMAGATGGAVAAWGKRAELLRPRAAAFGLPVITIEDGFLRSVGLGAGFVPALSYVFDDLGIYYDPARPSAIERTLAHADFGPELLDRSRRLIDLIRQAGVTKYNLAGRQPLPDLPSDREVILVPGQVADDQSIIRGAPGLFSSRSITEGGANLALLEAVRDCNPSACIVYRPHPDVEAGFRQGRIAPENLRRLADCIDHGSPLTDLLERVDRVETATSLLGFEALVRGRPVTTHGTPFYAGWGLTEDLVRSARRGRARSLEELAAAALILYPVYLDPASLRVCPVETAVRHLAGVRDGPDSASVRLRSNLGRKLARLRGVAQMIHIRIKRIRS